MLGTLEDIIKIFKVGASDAVKLDTNTIVKTLATEFDKVGALLHDVFPELTEAERKRIKSKELAVFIINLITYAIGQITNIQTRKN